MSICMYSELRRLQGCQHRACTLHRIRTQQLKILYKPGLSVGSTESNQSGSSALHIVLFVTKNNDLTQSDWDEQ